MSQITLAMSEPIWAELTAALDNPQESACVLVVQPVHTDENITLLASSVHWAPAESYLKRSTHGLELRSNAWVPAMRAAAREGGHAVFVHTHPNGTARFSERDDNVDSRLQPIFEQHVGRYASMIVAGTSNSPIPIARVGTSSDLVNIDVFRVVGDRLTIIRPDNGNIDESFDRQVRAFGPAGQQILSSLRVGIVGVGGTGSAVAEQLLRLGVGEIVAIDDDRVTAPSVTRGYGSGHDSIDKPKVQVVAELAERIGLGTLLTPVEGNLREFDVARQLAHCDVIFSCTDGHAARLILNRVAYWNLIPVIDLAVLISTTNDTVSGIEGRVTWLSPGAACLLCRQRIDPHAAWAEHLSADERRDLAAQGYVPDIETPQPSVVTYTSLVASLATTELLHRLLGVADVTATETLARIQHRSVSNNRRKPRSDCFCGQPTKWAQGAKEPYLDLTWATEG